MEGDEWRWVRNHHNKSQTRRDSSPSQDLGNRLRQLKGEDLIKSPGFKELESPARSSILMFQYQLTALDNFDKKYPSLFRNHRVLECQPRSTDRDLQLALIAQMDGPDV